MKQLIILALGVLLSLNVFADRRVGNGGDARIDGVLVELLDLAEKQAFQPDFSDYYEKEVLPRLRKIESAYLWYHNKYHIKEEGFLYLNNLLKESEERLYWFFTKSDLPEINDEGVDIYEIEIEGSIKQLAIQIKNVVIVNEVLFNGMTDKHKAGLILHELVLNHVLNTRPEVLNYEEYGKVVGTSKIRTFVSFMLIDTYDKISSKKIISAFRRIKVKDIQGPDKRVDYEIADSITEEMLQKPEFSNFLSLELAPVFKYTPQGDIITVREEFKMALKNAISNKKIVKKLSSHFLSFAKNFPEEELKSGDLGEYQYYYNLWVVRLATEYNRKGKISRVLSGGVNRNEAREYAALEVSASIFKRWAEKIQEQENSTFEKVYLN